MKSLVQLISIVMIAVGMTYEIMAGAHLGYILITGGALVGFISSKVKPSSGGIHQ